MADFSFQMRTSNKKPFVLIYGPAGIGKTTFAANAPDPVFLQTEDGGGELEIMTLKDGVFKSYDEFMDALRMLYTAEKGSFGTVVIDSIDHLEPLVWDYVCQKNDWTSIEQPGYGRGYIECDKAWKNIIDALNRVKEKHDVGIIALAHDQVRIINDPMVDAYEGHELKLHKRASALWKETSDVIGLLRPIIVKDQKTGKAKGGSSPTLFVRPNAAYVAKTRYLTMPSSLPISPDEGWNDFAKYIPAYNNGEK